MTIWFVSRHAGATAWLADPDRLARHGLDVDLADAGTDADRGDVQRVTHLDADRVQPGDVVVGTLPINLVADLNARDVRYLHLTLILSEEARGRELTAEDMDRLGAKLVEYRATRIDR